MPDRYVAALVVLALGAGCGPSQEHNPRNDSAEGHAAHADLQTIVRSAPNLTFEAVDLKAQPPRPGWQLGTVSWVAADRNGRMLWLLQRGDPADPIVVMDRDGHVLRSWGRGKYTKPHAIRVDPQGNIWTTDAATSIVRKFTPQGRQLLEIAVAGQPSPCMDQQIIPESERATGPNNFCGTTDVAFAANGHIFIADGYANNRILEYGADGKRLNEWGSAGTGPGQFHLPHSIAVDDSGVLFVADRENGRIQRFDLAGNHLGEWPNLGRVYSLKVSGGALWLVTQPLELPNSAPGWILKLDRATGAVLGYVDIIDGHSIETLDTGELIASPESNGAAARWLRPVLR